MLLVEAWVGLGRRPAPWRASPPGGAVLGKALKSRSAQTSTHAKEQVRAIIARQLLCASADKERDRSTRVRSRLGSNSGTEAEHAVVTRQVGRRNRLNHVPVLDDLAIVHSEQVIKHLRFSVPLAFAYREYEIAFPLYLVNLLVLEHIILCREVLNGFYNSA